MKRLLFGFLLAAVAGCSPERPEAVSQRAESAYASGHYGRAISSYEQLLALTGENAATYYNLALSSLAAQDTAAARRAAEQSLKLAPEGVIADGCQEILGMAAEAVKEPQVAVGHYRKALQSSDTALRVRVCSRLARIYAEQKRPDAALALLLMASNLAPQGDMTLYGMTLFNLGKLCVDEPLRMYQEALDSFAMAERVLPENSPQAKEARNRVKQLEQHLARLNQVPPSPRNAKACREAMKNLREAKLKKRWRTAEEAAEKAAKADPSSFEAALEWARMCVQNNHRDKALKAYEQAIMRKSNDVEARHEAARLACDLKDYEAAARFLRPAVVNQRRNIALVDRMTRIVAARKQPADARLWGEYYLSLDEKATEGYRKWVEGLPEK